MTNNGSVWSGKQEESQGSDWSYIIIRIIIANNLLLEY